MSYISHKLKLNGFIDTECDEQVNSYEHSKYSESAPSIKIHLTSIMITISTSQNYFKFYIKAFIGLVDTKKWDLLRFLHNGLVCSITQTHNNNQQGCHKMQARIANRPAAGGQPLHSRHHNLIRQEKSRSKQKHSSRSKQSTANLKKRPNRKERRLKQETSFADLFNSARDLVVSSKPAPVKAKKGRQKKATLVSSSNKFEESTASREFKLKTKQYDDPNGEYFGSKISIKQRKNGRSKKRERDKGEINLTKSLELKIRSLRRMESLHSSESESIKSDLSEKELRRLEKMHSLERLNLMEEIIDMQEKRIRKKKRRS